MKRRKRDDYFGSCSYIPNYLESDLSYINKFSELEILNNIERELQKTKPKLHIEKTNELTINDCSKQVTNEQICKILYQQFKQINDDMKYIKSKLVAIESNIKQEEKKDDITLWQSLRGLI